MASRRRAAPDLFAIPRTIAEAERAAKRIGARMTSARAIREAEEIALERATRAAAREVVPLTPREMGQVREQRRLAREQLAYQRKQELLGAMPGRGRKRVPTVQEISSAYGPEAAVDYAQAMGMYPEDWAQDVADEWGDDYDIDVHDLFDEFFGYGTAEVA